MNPNYVLIVVDKPDQKNQDEWAGWLQFRDATPEVLSVPANAESLAENVWLLNLEKGLSTTVSLLNTATQRHLKYRTWFFKEAPDWIYSHSSSEGTPKFPIKLG